ncbi:hypothetical protein VE03_01933 [Pseudogymnoascus sp. 23342-1-I1]|nr:hypothetical protein VE03_01933 [Pseudogymnoascus sp. 23342-1-I1]
MSGIAEASLVLGIISSIISIVTAAKNIYDVAKDKSGLPRAFHHVAAKLPIVLVILKQASDYAQRPEVDEDTRDAFQGILSRCETSAKELREIFEKSIPKEGASRFDRSVTAARTVRKGSRVEDLIAEILKEIALLLASSSFASQNLIQKFDEALEKVSLADAHTSEHLITPISSRVNSQREGQVTRLKEIRYEKDHSREKNEDPKAYLAEWLLPLDPQMSSNNSTHDLSLEKRFHNPNTAYTTCQWFFDSCEYRKFVDAESSKVLRINGSPGCGKTVLSSAIINQLETLNDGMEIPRVLFCYACRDPEKITSMALVRILLAQALKWASPEIITELEKSHQKYRILKDQDSNAEEELWRVLRKALELQSQKVYIIIDGLDECAQPLVCVRSLVKLMIKLEAKTHCGLLICSRLQLRDVFDHKNVSAPLKKSKIELLQLEISPTVSRQDLLEYVSFQVESRSSFLTSPQLVRDRIVETVCEKAKGMFLYANLVLEDLKGETISSLADIDRTVTNLPEDISITYKQNLEVPKRSRRGLETFCWIFCSNPALTWLEIKSALAIGIAGYDDNSMILDSCDSFIGHTCGHLVESYGESERLRFIHPTVKDFMLDHSRASNDFDISGADGMIASKLLTFLEYPDLPYLSSADMSSPEQIIKEYSLRTGKGLYSFATFNWYKHLKKCDKTENVQLENQVVRFLRSKFFLRWLMTAIVMSHASRDGGDIASLTTDVIDSLQSWATGRAWSDESLESTLQSWMKDFLDLMLDWGKAIETQPDWIHYLHQQFLSEHSCFREMLDNFYDDSIIQLEQANFSTRRSEAATWPGHCLALDLERDLAFTYEEPFISCYHTKTCLLAAEIPITVPHNITGPLVARRGLLCPQGKYLAIVFEAMGASTDPVGAKIRAGRRITVNDGDTAFKWSMDDALAPFDFSGIFAHLAVGVDYAEFVICLLRLQHTGPARTNLFALPSWTTSPILVTGSQAMRWDLDDVDVLQFSNDSSTLATAFGIFDLETGQRRNPWPFALDLFYQGGKLTKDFSTFATILRDIEGDCILQLHQVNTIRAGPHEFSQREIRFKGIIHLLAISNHGRFLLLTRRDAVKDTKKNKLGKDSMYSQVAIGVWDTRDGEWTPLLALDRQFVDKLAQWNLCSYDFEPAFGPEAEQQNEVNSVFLYVPSKWKLATNVRKVKAMNPAEDHLLLFETQKCLKGFGKNPTVKLQIPATLFRSNGNSRPSLRFMSWGPRHETAIVLSNISVQHMDHNQLRDSTSSLLENRGSFRQFKSADGIIGHAVELVSAVLFSPSGSAMFHIQLSSNPKDSTDGGDFLYELSIECFLTGETQVTSSSIKLVVPRDLINAPSAIEHICSSDEGSISLGPIEVDIEHGYEEISIELRDPAVSVFQKALDAFRHCAHPLRAPPSDISTVGFVKTTSNTRYVIFEDALIHVEGSGLPSGASSGSFTMKGDTLAEDHQHVFQISRRVVRNLTKDSEREARQFETVIFVYDEESDKVTWMTHGNTGGDIGRSRNPFPEAAWALHHELPLLAWLLPESLTIETDPIQAIKFSRDGRYVLIQARESFKNNFMSLKRSTSLWSVVVCDLQEGRSIGATLRSENNVTMDLEDNMLHTYRLTRDGAVEDTAYSLPSLALTGRQYLTFIPAGCRCPTCGKSLNSQCFVSVIEYEGVKTAVLGHTMAGVGKTTAVKETCRPLIVRITTPPIELNIEGIHEAVFSRGSVRLFPKVIDEQGGLIEDAFESQRTCTKEADSDCICALCLSERQCESEALEPTRITQMVRKITDFKLPSGLAVPPEQMEEVHRLAELGAAKKMSIHKESEISATAKDSVENMKRMFGEETFPWDSWVEFRETMEEVKEEFDHRAHMKRMFEPGNSGIGCQIPVSVYTLYFGEGNEDSSFHWSSAAGTGWLEEDLEWYYERFFGGDFKGARRWYLFPAYNTLGKKMDELNEDQTAKGRRFRKYFLPKRDEAGKVLEIEPPDVEDQYEIGSNSVKLEKELRPMVGGLVMKDFYDSISDLVPGLGKIFEQRLHAMLNETMMGAMEE